ncbi:hypothetical protein IEQ34_024220 [Dendrobium chrysotoxum]|uniref:Uncharacterized protein n=1 Tax=Dendrobium chrysotoxum TaxID=161865 RepID=A0AAV7FSS5_DENCH|nr:hypothetical protein IEQ34_024220 [Dendrobium chrysotoxum]
MSFLLLDQPSEEANTTGTLISKINEVAIHAKTANWKAIVIIYDMVFIWYIMNSGSNPIEMIKWTPINSKKSILSICRVATETRIIYEYPIHIDMDLSESGIDY